MYQFFVEDEQVQQDKICIVGSDVNHIGHVLRMKTGEKIRISDQSGRSYFFSRSGLTGRTMTRSRRFRSIGRMLTPTVVLT